MQGTLKAPIRTIFWCIFWDFSGPYGPIRAHMGPYGPIWARMGPYGPGPGPWRAGKVQKKTHISFSIISFFVNRRFWSPDNVFWWKNNVLQVSGRNTVENACKITSKSKFSTRNMQIPYYLHPALSYSLEISIGSQNFIWICFCCDSEGVRRWVNLSYKV